MKVISHIDVPLHLRRIRSEKLWTFAANEWFKLITPFVPMDTGTLSTTVEIEAENNTGTIKYIAPYAKRMYYNDYNFRKDRHPKATSKWDKAAEPTQKKKLIAAMQKYVESGRLEL